MDSQKNNIVLKRHSNSNGVVDFLSENKYVLDHY